MQAGCKGVKLEYVQLGATRMTSVEGLKRFFQHLTEAGESTVSEPELPHSRQREIEAAEARLAASR